MKPRTAATGANGPGSRAARPAAVQQAALRARRSRADHAAVLPHRGAGRHAGSPAILSTLITSSAATRYCFPPVLMTANICPRVRCPCVDISVRIGFVQSVCAVAKAAWQPNKQRGTVRPAPPPLCGDAAAICQEMGQMVERSNAPGRNDLLLKMASDTSRNLPIGRRRIVGDIEVARCIEP